MFMHKYDLFAFISLLQRALYGDTSVLLTLCVWHLVYV